MKIVTAFTMTLALAAMSFAQTAPATATPANKDASAPVKASKVSKKKNAKKAKSTTASPATPAVSK